METKTTEYNTTLAGMWTKNGWAFETMPLTDEAIKALIQTLQTGGKIVFKVAKTRAKETSPGGYLEFMDATKVAKFTKPKTLTTRTAQVPNEF